MEPRSRKLHPFVAVASVALILMAGVAIAAFTGLLPGTRGAPEEQSRPATEASPQVHRLAPHAEHAQQQMAPAPGKCLDCGVVNGVLQVTVPGESTGAGAVVGGVGGAVIGNQIGDDRHDRLLGRVIGAVGGALAGNEIEKHARQAKRWDVTVVMRDGSQKVVSYSERPEWRAGDHVRVVGGRLVAESG